MRNLISTDLLKDKDLLQQAQIICITTNGFVKRNGECVMGRGIAKQMKEYIPSIPYLLGYKISSKGNHVYNLGRVNSEKLMFNKHWLISFPVKHNWWEDADPELIRRSAIELKQLMKGVNKNVLIPRPGCGNGHLRWQDVKPILEEVFGDDDRFIIVSH